MSELSANLEKEDGSSKGGHILKAKFKLMDLLVLKLGDYFQGTESKQAGEILTSIAQQYTLFLN